MFLITNKKRQAGVTLIMGMVMVLLITIIGLAAIRGSGLQEQMAGNMRERNLAFQSAEAALREGESFLASGPSSVPLGSTGFMESMDRPSQSYWINDFNWGGAAVFSGTLSHVAEQPRYVVEQVKTDDPGQFGGATDFQSTLDAEESITYRITSRGVGGAGTSVAILQSTYK